MSLERFHVPDLSIGATVLIVAIALPFFVFTRMEHLHRVQAKASPPTSATPYQAAISTPDPTTTPGDSPSANSLPATGPSATAKAKPSKSARATVRAIPSPTGTSSGNPSATPDSTPTAAPTSTPTPTPTGAPVANLVVTVTGPLAVTADANGSTDTSQTPISQTIFDFGDGTPAQAGAGRTAAHTYASAGRYYVQVTVIDSVRASSTTGQWVTV